MKRNWHRYVALYLIMGCVFRAYTAHGAIYVLDSYDQSPESKYHAAALIARGEIVEVRMVEDPVGPHKFMLTFAIASVVKGKEHETVDIYATSHALLRCFPHTEEHAQRDVIDLDMLAQRLPMEAIIVCQYHYTVEAYRLFQCIGEDEWDEIERFAGEYTRRAE